MPQEPLGPSLCCSSEYKAKYYSFPSDVTAARTSESGDFLGLGYVQRDTIVRLLLGTVATSVFVKTTVDF